MLKVAKHNRIVSKVITGFQHIKADELSAILNQTDVSLMGMFAVNKAPLLAQFVLI